MVIEGFFKPSHVVRTCLEHEYAFEVVYPKYTLRVAHTKGVWSCVKLLGAVVVDRIEINDCWGGSACDNDLTRALYENIEQRHADKALGAGIRREEARCIEEFLSIWGGRAAEIQKILVIQPGRNAWVDESGEFECSARVEEFKS